jgi:hypothetical protein
LGSGEIPIGLSYAAESGASEAVRVRLNGLDLGIVVEPGMDAEIAWRKLRSYLNREGLT